MHAPEVQPDPDAPLLSCHLLLFLRDFSLSQSRLQSGGFFLYFSYFLGQVGHLVEGPLGRSPREKKQAQRCSKDSRHLIYSHGSRVTIHNPMLPLLDCVGSPSGVFLDSLLTLCDQI